MKTLTAKAFFGIAALAVGSAAGAAHLIDTGTPNGSIPGAYAFDSNDYYAGQVSFAGAAQLQAISAHILGGTTGETFSIVLYGDSAQHLPGLELYSAEATFGADGWNGASGLVNWTVAAGTYWIGLEIGSLDTLGTSSITGALLDVGAPRPLNRTAVNPGSGYQADSTALGFGLQVDATVTAVPEPEALTLLLTGLLAGSTVLSRRRAR